jgi:hypothetical protein
VFGIPGRVPGHEIQTGLHDKGSYFKVVGTFHQLVEPYVGRSLALHNAAHNVGCPRFKSFCECVVGCECDGSQPVTTSRLVLTQGLPKQGKEPSKKHLVGIYSVKFLGTGVHVGIG